MAHVGGLLLEGLLFGVTADNDWILLIPALSLAGVALLAGYLPARRACRLDRSRSLRTL